MAKQDTVQKSIDLYFIFDCRDYRDIGDIGDLVSFKLYESYHDGMDITEDEHERITDIISFDGFRGNVENIFDWTEYHEGKYIGFANFSWKEDKSCYTSLEDTMSYSIKEILPIEKLESHRSASKQ